MSIDDTNGFAKLDELVQYIEANPGYRETVYELFRLPTKPPPIGATPEHSFNELKKKLPGFEVVSSYEDLKKLQLDLTPFTKSLFGFLYYEYLICGFLNDLNARANTIHKWVKLNNQYADVILGPVLNYFKNSKQVDSYLSYLKEYYKDVYTKLKNRYGSLSQNNRLFISMYNTYITIISHHIADYVFSKGVYNKKSPFYILMSGVIQVN
jgi:hypothetical protein